MIGESGIENNMWVVAKLPGRNTAAPVLKHEENQTWMWVLLIKRLLKLTSKKEGQTQQSRSKGSSTPYRDG